MAAGLTKDDENIYIIARQKFFLADERVKGLRSRVELALMKQGFVVLPCTTLTASRVEALVSMGRSIQAKKATATEGTDMKRLFIPVDKMGKKHRLEFERVIHDTVEPALDLLGKGCHRQTGLAFLGCRYGCDRQRPHADYDPASRASTVRRPYSNLISLVEGTAIT